MADGTIASAVALPEQEESPDSSLKRRQSPADDNKNKRRRLSENNNQPESGENKPSSLAATTSKTINNATDQRESRRKNGAAEERKRGQRLFGALLGTLSQSSPTAAQKRRADIEKKQQAKLRMQEEEYNELTRRKQEDLLAMRRKQQRIYDAQSMRLRHSNQLAMAHFLKTTAEPVLYYKPWELRPEEEDRIKKQIEDCKMAIAREVEDFEAKNAPSPSRPVPERDDDQATAADEISSVALPGTYAISDSQDTVQKFDTVGADTDSNHNPPQHEHKAEPTTTTETESLKPPLPFTAPATSDPPTVSDATNETSTSLSKTHNDHPSTAGASHYQKSTEDDSGEVILEDKEDTVIY
ncbi:pinin/SDK/memA domain-containing protein [Histoplasma capsulatum var. duboisii H88]|nr:pinin/SDK/memA domain-containing protein [Histoplasma capsulatum H143]EGC43802.1 pinin/SDK/memA domain-containing protein [Histoplasma capsulatum var. duboisii H88]